LEKAQAYEKVLEETISNVKLGPLAKPSPTKLEVEAQESTATVTSVYVEQNEVN
jgi:hypothetical protein